MDGGADSNEDIEVINNRPLVPASTSTSGNNDGGTATSADGDTNDDESSSPDQQPNAIPLHPLLFLLLNNTFIRPGGGADEATSTGTDIKRPLDYLRQLVAPPQEIVHDPRAIQSLIEINDIFRKNKDKISVIIESKLQLVLKELFQYEFECLREYVDSGELSIETENTSPKFTTLHLICDLAEILVVSSKEFAALFHMVGGSKCFLAFFTHKPLYKYMTQSMTRQDQYRSERKMNYNKALASMLNSLLYLKNNRTMSFKELNAIDVLAGFANSLTFENCELILRAHFVLSVLAERRQIEQLENIDFTILILEKTIQMFAQACQKKTKYNSYQFDLFYDNDVRSFEISSNNSPNTFIVIVLSVIEAFLVNDEIKYRVFSTIKNSLLILLIQGDIIEKYFALNLLINFAFDDVLNEKIRQIPAMAGVIEQLLVQSQQIDESVQSLIACLKSQLEIRKLVTDYKARRGLLRPSSAAPGSSALNTPRVPEPTGPVDVQRILISYHEVNELPAMKIRNELEKVDLAATLIERKSPTSQKIDIDLVIKSIGECDLMILCISPSYEYDKLSQFEAELAIRLGKPYVIVNVQAKYVPDYWLESLVENRNVVTFGLSTAKNDMLFVIDEIDSKARGIRTGGGGGGHNRRIGGGGRAAAGATSSSSALTQRAKSATLSRQPQAATAAGATPPRMSSSKLCTLL